MAVSGSFFRRSPVPNPPRLDPRPCERKPRIGLALRRHGLTEPPFGTKNWLSPFTPRTVVKTGAWAFARQGPVRRAGMRRRGENQRAPPPLTNCTPVFWLRRGTSPPVRPKSLAKLEKRIPKICRKRHDLRAIGLGTGVDAACRRSDQPGRRGREPRCARTAESSVMTAQGGLTALESMVRNASENLSPSVPLLAAFEPIRLLPRLSSCSN